MEPVLGDEQRAQLRGLMAAERERIEAQSTAMRLTFDELVAAADLEPPDDEHDPDGTTAYERAQVSSMRASLNEGLAALDAARASLDAGTYGRCSVCDAPIAFERLVAVLGTDVCVTCAAGRR